MAVAGKLDLEVDDGTVSDQREMCEMCENSPSAGYCSGCEGYLCQSCFVGHIKRKIYRNHVLQDAPESKEDDSTVHFKNCTDHRQQEVRIFCIDHQCFGCAECILLKHKTCNWEYILDASKKYQESGELARFIEDIRMLETTQEECTNSVASQTELVNKIHRTNISDVQQSMKNVVSYVNEEEKRLLDDAKVKKSTNDKKIEKLADDLKELGTEIKSISTDVNDEDKTHELFILVIETKPKINKIKDALASIDFNNVIDRYTFHPTRLLQVLLSKKQSLGKLTDNTRSGDEDDVDFERKYNAECLINQQLKQQLSTQQQNIQVMTSDMRKLQVENDDLRKKSLEVTLVCGHECSIEKMNENRTIQCPTCGIISGDQPFGTLKTNEHPFLICLKFTFVPGLQSKLNLNPGKPYKDFTLTGYLKKCQDGQLLSNMLKLAFDRRLLFTINTNGQIVTNGIDMEPALYWSLTDTLTDMWQNYFKTLTKQLKLKGITEADV